MEKYTLTRCSIQVFLTLTSADITKIKVINTQRTPLVPLAFRLKVKQLRIIPNFLHDNINNC